MCATGKEEWGGTWGGAGKKKKKEKADSYTLGKTDQSAQARKTVLRGNPLKEKSNGRKGTHKGERERGER